MRIFTDCLLDDYLIQLNLGLEDFMWQGSKERRLRLIVDRWTNRLESAPATIIFLPVMDYDGMSMFHCHIVEHEDIGMMGLWHIMGDGMPM